jgi:conjugal transfer pilus assembly protein TraW
VARVTGIYDIAYLKDKTGDLGVAGPAVGVVERTLLMNYRRVSLNSILMA